MKYVHTEKNHEKPHERNGFVTYILVCFNWIKLGMIHFLNWTGQIKNDFSMIIILLKTNDANWKVKQPFGQLKVNYAIWKFVKNSLKICLFVSTDWIGWNVGCICMKWCRYRSKEKWVHIVLNEKITHFDVALVVDY